MDAHRRFLDPHGISLKEEPVFIEIQELKGPITPDANCLFIQLHGCAHVKVKVQNLLGLVLVHLGVE